MSKQKFNLVVVAHPDDESIFFGGLIMQHRARPWKVVVVTDGNAAGDGGKRFEDLKKACKLLGVKKIETLGFRDIYSERLPFNDVAKKLRLMQDCAQIFTHSIVGDYGHPHHQDVALAVTLAFAKNIFYIAQNCFADKVVKLSAKSFQIKTKILSEIYFSETARFQSLLPARRTEEFAKLDPLEIQHVYDVLLGRQKLDAKRLSKYRWYAPYLDPKHATLDQPI